MLILHNGRIRTMDAQHPIASALGIENGRVCCLSEDDSLAAMAEPKDQLVNLYGKTVWPGLTDAHLHLEMYATSLQLVDCETPTRQECLERVRLRAQSLPQGAWVLGHGWNQNNWPEGFGSAADLDAVAPHHPVYLTAKSLHASWANSPALKRAGITASTPDPEGGSIQRDARGQPTGILLESATGLVERILPKPGDEAVAAGLEVAQQALWQMGITSVHDFDRRRCFNALQQLQSRDRLRLRVVKGIPLEDLDCAVALGLRGGFGNDMLRIGSVKAFADGALGPQTAAMLQPYEGNPSNSGFLLMDSEQVFEAGQKAAAAGLSMAIHAIGDRANHEVLEGYAQLRQFEAQNGIPERRHRIEHVQILHEQDMNRLFELKVIASVQPIHATSDMEMADRYWGHRSSGAYAFNSLLRSGARLAFGSDAPVESPNPFLGLHAAVTRQRPNGEPGEMGWYPEQRLELFQALQAYTTGPAFAAGTEDRQGKLVPGYFADLILLETDPFTLPPRLLHAVKPLATMVAGEWVWQA